MTAAVQKYGRWTSADDVVIARHYGTSVPVVEIAQAIGRTKGALIQRAMKLGITRAGDTAPISRPKPAVVGTNRVCMNRACAKPFLSTGNHHRHCDRCRRRVSGPDDYSITGVRA